MEKRVVITGIGAITPIGKTANETWNGIKNKECGIDEIKLFNAENFKTKFDAEVKEKNAYVYERSGEFSGMLRLLRKTGFKFYSLIIRLSKIRNG